MASDMTVQPLPKHLFDRAKALAIKAIELNFSGGSDEGHFQSSLTATDGTFVAPDNPAWREFSALQRSIDEWADSVYEYSGAGDGSEYGDDIAYDLVENKVTTSDWYMERTEGDDTETKLEIESEEPPDDDQNDDEAGEVQERSEEVGGAAT